MAFGDVTLRANGGERTGTQTSGSDSITVASGEPVVFGLTALLTSGTPEDLPSVTPPSGVTATFAGEVVLDSTRVLYVWILTGSGSGTISWTAQGSDVWGQHSWVGGGFDACSGTPVQVSTGAGAYGTTVTDTSLATTGAGNITIAVVCKTNVSATSTPRSSPSYSKNDTAGPTLMNGNDTAESCIEIHWYQGSDTQVDVTWDSGVGAALILGLELEPSGGGGGGGSADREAPRGAGRGIMRGAVCAPRDRQGVWMRQNGIYQQDRRLVGPDGRPLRRAA